MRSLVGLDRETAKQAFSQFVVGTTAIQLEFINLIVEELTENGVMDSRRGFMTRRLPTSTRKGRKRCFCPAG